LGFLNELNDEWKPADTVRCSKPTGIDPAYFRFMFRCCESGRSILVHMPVSGSGIRVTTSRHWLDQIWESQRSWGHIRATLDGRVPGIQAGSYRSGMFRSFARLVQPKLQPSRTLMHGHLIALSEKEDLSPAFCYFVHYIDTGKVESQSKCDYLDLLKKFSHRLRVQSERLRHLSRPSRLLVVIQNCFSKVEITILT
jgi:hypothetical protein